MSASNRSWSQYALMGALAAVPIAAALRYLLDAPPLAVFATGGIAIAVLAEWMRRATEQVAVHAGPAIGGLLNVSFGSAAELILALFVIAGGQAEVVRAQITGSIIGTSLLGLGLACIVGGLGREHQTFSGKRAGLQASLLTIVAMALLLPAVFDRADAARAVSAAARSVSEEELSIGVAVVLLLLYAGNLVFTLVTHRDVFARNDEKGESGDAAWSLPWALGVLVLATLAVAGCAELVSDALGEAAATLHLPLAFVGRDPAGADRNGRRPVRGDRICAGRPNEPCDDDLRRLVDPGGASGGAATGADLMGDGTSAEPGLPQRA